jgi:GNAT superfamily N-acetyltransferase
MLRPFVAADLAAAAELQALCYPPALCEPADALLSRLTIAGHACFVATAGARLVGYILAHPWPGLDPPPVGAVLEQPPAGPLVHYLHDLAIAPALRGTGLGRALVTASQAAARQAGLNRSELMAVAGAAPFWHALGYEAVPADARLTAQVRAYGSGARYLARPL